MAQVSAYEVFVNLLYTPSVPVRMLALKCIGRLLMLNKHSRTKYFADGSFGFSFITNLLRSYPFTEETYITLRDIFLGQISLDDKGALSTMRDFDELDIQQTNGGIGSGVVTQSDGSLYQFEVQAVLDSIFKLLLTASMDVKMLVLQDWKLQLKSFHVQDIFLKQSSWQTWLFSLMANHSFTFGDGVEENASDVDLADVKVFFFTFTIVNNLAQDTNMEAVEEIILDIITILLYHALIHSKQGWRIVEETVSHLYMFEVTFCKLFSILIVMHRKVVCYLTRKQLSVKYGYVF